MDKNDPLFVNDLSSDESNRDVLLKFIGAVNEEKQKDLKTGYSKQVKKKMQVVVENMNELEKSSELLIECNKKLEDVAKHLKEKLEIHLYKSKRLAKIVERLEEMGYTV